MKRKEPNNNLRIVRFRVFAETYTKIVTTLEPLQTVGYVSTVPCAKIIGKLLKGNEKSGGPGRT